MKRVFTLLCFGLGLSAYSQSFQSVAHPVVCAIESTSQRASVPAVPSMVSSVPAIPGFVGGYLFPWTEDMQTGISHAADDGRLSCRWDGRRLLVSGTEADMEFDVYGTDGRLYGKGKGRGIVSLPESCRIVIVRTKTSAGRHALKLVRP